MANLMISIVVTIVLAVLFHAWLGVYQERKEKALRHWAAQAGWRVRSAPAQSTLPAAWALYEPAADWRKPSLSLEGERDGRPLILEWIEGDEWVATVCYAALHTEHPVLTLRRRLFAQRLAPRERYRNAESLPPQVLDLLGVASVDSWHLCGGYLAAVSQDWLRPRQLETLLGEVTAVGAALDGTISHRQ